MESYIPISFLNDFIFCPRSIYFHQLYGRTDAKQYQETAQVAGKEAHSSIDEQRYSTRKEILQGIEIYSERYNLCGKIDTFDTLKGALVERKRSIITIYDGYVFQLYAHYHALTEMRYTVRSMAFYDISHNKQYPVPLPSENPEMQQRFEEIVERLNNFSLCDSSFAPVEAKCKRCIYSPLCDVSLC